MSRNTTHVERQGSLNTELRRFVIAPAVALLLGLTSLAAPASAAVTASELATPSGSSASGPAGTLTLESFEVNNRTINPVTLAVGPVTTGDCWPREWLAFYVTVHSDGSYDPDRDDAQVEVKGVPLDQPGHQPLIDPEPVVATVDPRYPAFSQDMPFNFHIPEDLRSSTIHWTATLGVGPASAYSLQQTSLDVRMCS